MILVFLLLLLLIAVFLAAVVAIATVCQPISFGSVFWQVNMRFSKYFCLLSVPRVCLLFAHTYIIFNTLTETIGIFYYAFLL